MDEVHRLQNPSEILKIAADHYPSVRILSTGFEKDTLLFFYELLNVTPPKARDAARAIVEEEKRHVQLLSEQRKRFAPVA